jgi:D-glucosaminate-6-phosphate ammonia-lyase
VSLFEELQLATVINAAGKLTALGGSSLREDVIEAMAEAGRSHVDLAALRRAAGAEIARLAGAEAGTVTAGASASLIMAVAGCITGVDSAKVARIPDTAGLANRVPIQVGHLVNFGAPIEQMIRIGGGVPVPVGSVNSVTPRALEAALEAGGAACMMFVVSHHATQTNQLPLETCLVICHERSIPVVVDAAAEEDLQRYLVSGADLVAYSGGKAFEGPTTGILLGRADLVAAADAQMAGVARPMKVGKEDILGLVAALRNYVHLDTAAEKARQDCVLDELRDAAGSLPGIELRAVPDEAGREINRLALLTTPARAKELSAGLAAGSPSVRTRNHHLYEGIVLIDPRALTSADARIIAARLRELCRESVTGRQRS